MGRPFVIVALVALLMATGVAAASPANQVRLPVTINAADGPADYVIVEKGDHLWKISERHLDRHEPDQEVGPYWRRVIDVNTPELRSGNPDLIYPGELIVLPEINERP